MEDYYTTMDDLIDELGGPLEDWIVWYEHLAGEQEEIAEAVITEEIERDRVAREADEARNWVRIVEELRMEARKMEVQAERAKPALNITFYIKNGEKGKRKGKGKGKGEGKAKGKGRKGQR